MMACQIGGGGTNKGLILSRELLNNKVKLTQHYSRLVFQEVIDTSFPGSVMIL